MSCIQFRPKGQPVSAKYHKTRWLLAALAFLQIWTCGGICFGWQDMESFLRKERVFESYGKDAQDKKFAALFTAASTSITVAFFPNGWCVDRFGPKVTAILSSLVFAAGLGLLAFSSSTFEAYMPAVILLGIASPGPLFAAFHMSHLFAGYEGIFVAFCNGFFDSASLMPKLLLVISDFTNYSLETMLLGYLASFGLLSFLLSVFLWPVNPFVPALPAASRALSDEEREKAGGKESVMAGAVVVPDEEDEEARPLLDTKREQGPDAASGRLNWLNFDLCSLPFWGQAFRAEYVLFLFYFAALNLRFSVFIPSVPSHYDNGPIFGYILPWSLVFNPTAGLFLKQFGFVKGLTFISSLFVLWATLSVIPSEPLQIGTFVVFIAFRAYFFSITTAYVAFVFGYKTMGRLLGFANCFAAAIGAVQEPLIPWMATNWYLANGVLAVPGLLSFLLPALLWYRARPCALITDAS